MKNVTILCIVTVILSTLGYAQTNVLEPKGAYKDIDVAKHNGVIGVLTGNDEVSKQTIVDSVISNPNNYNPPAIFAVSKALFDLGKKDEAAFWFYVAQLRARYDANLCLDNSAKQAVSVLNGKYGPDINKYTFQDIEKLEKIVIRVVDFVRSNEENYDHRWISLHGMGAVNASLTKVDEEKKLIEPKERWAEIKKKTIDDYYNGFIEYVKNQKKKD